MAPAAGLEGWANPPESILTLEESDKTFRALIYKACHILEIGLGDQWEQIIDVGFRAQSQIITADPRPEFALRWLLKKLQSPENYKNNPRFEWRAWILLRTLLLHTPISNSARLLKAQNLVTMLYESLQGLYDHCPKPQHLGNNEEWRLSDSSSDTVESSESKSRTSKKRRRDGTEAEGSHHLASVRKIETHKIFVAICGLLAQLQFFTVNQEPTQGYAKEHMKSSLKTKPEEAASILGNSLYLVNDILQAPYRSDSRRKTSLQKFENIACNFCVPSAIDFWVARSAGTPDSYDSTTNRAFRLHCMLPALQLLDTVRQWPSPENGTETVTVSLEKLLINHVILPFRAITAGGEQRVKPKDGDLPPSLADELTPALKQFRFPWPTERSPTSKTSYDTERSSIKTQEYMIVTLLSLMFDVALACCPRHLSRLRRSDDPWLGELFSQLSECAKQLVPQTSTIRARKTCARLTRWMLEKAVDYQLQLSLPTIETTLEQTSGLLTEEHDVDWSIISLCLSIDANAFIIPASPVGSDQAPPYRPPNELLSALLSEVTNLCFRPTPNARPDNYDYVLSHVVIPLCTAFSNGRNLMGFLSYWKEQLNVVQLERSKQASTSTDSTLWEDQNLLQSAAHLLESTLTPGQIDQLISAAAQGLNHPPGKVLDRKPISLASLILLDCLFAGVTSDATMMQLAATAQSVFSSLEVIRSSDWCRLDRWRMWRIEGTIADRWFPVHNTREFKKAAHSALSGAIQMINDTVLTNWKSAKIDLSEALHAFTYILRFIAKEDSFWEDPHFLSRQHVLSAVRNIIDAMEPFCGRIRQDIFGTIKSPDIVPTWDELNPSKPVSIDTFYIGCVGCILELPYILDYLDSELQTLLIEQFYWCAVYHQRLSQAMLPQSIDYSWPWTVLVQSDALDASSSLTNCLRTFLVDRYLKVSYFEDPRCWDIKTAFDYVVAFEGIQTIPVQALDRAQRSDIANRVLCILLQTEPPSLATTTDHLNLLAKIITIPKKSMHILTTTIDTKRKRETPPDPLSALISLACGIDGFIHWSAEQIDSVAALRRLTRSVMSYLFSTPDQESSVQCLDNVYFRLAAMMEQRYERQEGCTPALSSVIEVSWTVFSNHRHGLTGCLDNIARTLDLSRQYHLEVILRPFENLAYADLQDRDRRYHLGVSLDLLAEYLDLLGTHPDLRQISHRLFSSGGLAGMLREQKNILTPDEMAKLDTKPMRDECGFEYLKARLTRLEVLLGVRDSNLHPGLMGASLLLHELQARKERNDIVDCIRGIMPELALQSKKELCFDHDTKNGHTYLESSELHTLGIAIYSLHDEQAQDLRKEISRTFTLLCRSIVQPVPFHDCMLAMQCTNLLLQKQPRIISQWHLDNLLSTIATKSSYLEDRTEEKQSAMLYIGLCRILGTILALHRTKIGGRYHLVILALQSLLRCLFIPYAPTDSIYEPLSPFNVTQASAYARLLTTLSDPTVSSVSRPKNRSRLELNDETKKARSIAGQHLPYLIMEYCTSQLTGKLSPQMKAALEPALHAVLAVMTPEIMRTMNAALRESERVVWKALHEDWRRVGRSGMG